MRALHHDDWGSGFVQVADEVLLGIRIVRGGGTAALLDG